MLDVATPRFPGARPPHYESFFVRAWDAAVPRAVWIRYTTFHASGSAPFGSLWLTAFEPSGVTAMRRDGLPARPGPADRWIAVGDAAIVEDPDALVVSGAAEADGHTASWALRLLPGGDPWVHYPAVLYRAPIPRTKLTSPVLVAPVRGSVTIDGGARTYASAMLGHNWGTEHAHRWIWIHGTSDDGTVLDLAGGRLLVGGRLLPWRLTGVLGAGDRRRRIGGLLARARVDASEDRCAFEVGPVRGEVHAGALTRWRYDDPSGGAADVTHSSVSMLRVVVEGREIAMPCAAYELGVATQG